MDKELEDGQVSPEALERMAYLPVDESTLPDTKYFVVGGKVFSSKRWKDGSIARGEITLQQLEGLAGSPISKEGFYDFDGTYLGPTWTDTSAWDNPEDPDLDG